MSRILLTAIGGAVTDHNFRRALFNECDNALAKFHITDEDAVRELRKLVKHAGAGKIQQLMAELEPYICGDKLENCFVMKPVQKPSDQPPKGKEIKKQ